MYRKKALSSLFNAALGIIIEVFFVGIILVMALALSYFIIRVF